MKYFKRILVGLFIFFLGITSVYALDVNVKNITIKEKSSDIEVNSPTISGKNIESTIKFHKLNDYVTFEVVLDNDSDHTITGVTDNNENNYIKSSYTYEDSKFYLTLKYSKELSDDLELDEIEITVNFSDGSSETINPSPKTGDDILKYVVTLAISIIGLVIGIKLYKNETKIAVLVLIMLLPAIVYAANETLSSVYTLKTSKISIVKGEEETDEPDEPSEPVVQEITISYEANGGTGNTQDKIITKGESIGTLPEVTRDNYVLDGWYKESTFDNKVDSSFIPEDNIKLYAKWLKSVNGSTVDPEEMTVDIGTSKTITVTNVEEEYTFSSSDSSIATVDENGKVTGVKEGTVTITVTGTKSGETKTIEVDVPNPINYINRQTDGQISIGDEIAIGSEHFYVVSTDVERTVLLAKYNLYVGDIMNYISETNEIKYDSTISKEDSKYGLQNEIAIAQKLGESKFYGTVAFSGAKYWDDSEQANIYNSELNGTSPSYNYDKVNDYYAGGFASDNGYTIA